MPVIGRVDKGQVIVRFNPGQRKDDEVLERVRGWVYWQEMRVSYARVGNGDQRWQVAQVEMVAPAWTYDTVVEIVSGRLRRAPARCRTRRRSSRAPA